MMVFAVEDNLNAYYIDEWRLNSNRNLFKEKGNLDRNSIHFV